MSKGSKNLFHNSKSERLTDRAFNLQIAFSIMCIILSVICLTATSYALFSVEISTSEDNRVQAMDYGLTVLLDGEEVACETDIDLAFGEHTVTLTRTGNAPTGFCVITVNPDTENETVYYTEAITNADEPLELTLNAFEAGKVRFRAHWGEYSNYSYSYRAVSDSRIALGEDPGHLYASKLTNQNAYLYRVGNQNPVPLTSLFERIHPDIETDPAKFTYEIQPVLSGMDVSGCVANGQFTFTGAGVVRVKVLYEGKEASNPIFLEVLPAKNFDFTAGSALADLTAEANAEDDIVLLSDLTLNAEETLSLTGRTVYGNGFTVDLQLAGTKEEGILTLDGAVLDNVYVSGPVFDAYLAAQPEDAEKQDGYAAAVYVTGKGAKITNSRISGAASPIRMTADLELENVILSGGVYAGLIAENGALVLSDVTVVNENAFGVVIPETDDEESKVTVTLRNGFAAYDFTEKTDESNPSLADIRETVFADAEPFASLQFTREEDVPDSEEKITKQYVNLGIVSLRNDFTEDDLFDEREEADRETWALKVWKEAVLDSDPLEMKTVAIYGFDNSDPEKLVPAYAEPEYRASVQAEYEGEIVVTLTEAMEDAGFALNEEGIALTLKKEDEAFVPATLAVDALAEYEKYTLSDSIDPVLKSKVEAKVYRTEDGSEPEEVTLSEGTLSITEPGTYEISLETEDYLVFNAAGERMNEIAVRKRTITLTVLAEDGTEDETTSEEASESTDEDPETLEESASESSESTAETTEETETTSEESTAAPTEAPSESESETSDSDAVTNAPETTESPEESSSETPEGGSEAAGTDAP